MNKTLTGAAQQASLRLDKWLWCARFFKSRPLAATAIKSRHVSVNGSRAKPSRLIKAGDRLVIDKKGVVFEVDVLGVAATRLSAPLAQGLYRETAQSEEKRRQLDKIRKLDRLSAIKAPLRKPDKRSRRDRMKIKREFN